MAEEKILRCWSCGNEITITQRVTRNDFCPECENPLKCCYNCRFYDRNANNHCTEPQAEWVRYKEKANFCEYFDPRPPIDESQEVPDETLPFSLNAEARNRHRTTNDKERTKEAWDDLFKD